MSRIFLILIAFLAFSSSYSQPGPGIDQEKIDKINKTKSAEKKIRLYKRYLHKDSIRYEKEIDQRWQQKSDSIDKVLTARRESWSDKKKKLNEKVKNPLKMAQAELQITQEMYRFPSELELQYSRKQLNSYYATARYYIIEVSKDTSQVLLRMYNTREISGLTRANELQGELNIQVASLQNPLNPLKDGMNEHVQEKLRDNELLNKTKGLKDDMGKYGDDYRRYGEYGNMSVDSLKQMGMQRATEEVQSRVIGTGVGVSQQQMKQFNDLHAKYKSQLEDLQDSTKQRELAKQKAEEKAMEYLAENPVILQRAQRRMQLLMKKYSFISNSNDLSTAVSRTSLEGRSFRERLVFAANFQLLSIAPVSIDFSPQIGYKINSRFVIGIGGTYRKTFTDSLSTVSPDVFGYKTFSSFDIIRSFFGYGEYARNSPGVEVREDVSRRIWKPAALLGVGRKFSVHKKIDMTVVALYNFLHKPGDPIYPRPFMVRVGFQLSEIALLKRRPELKF